MNQTRPSWGSQTGCRYFMFSNAGSMVCCVSDLSSSPLFYSATEFHVALIGTTTSYYGGRSFESRPRSWLLFRDLPEFCRKDPVTLMGNDRFLPHHFKLMIHNNPLVVARACQKCRVGTNKQWSCEPLLLRCFYLVICLYIMSFVGWYLFAFVKVICVGWYFILRCIFSN